MGWSAATESQASVIVIELFFHLFAQFNSLSIVYTFAGVLHTFAFFFAYLCDGLAKFPQVYKLIVYICIKLKNITTTNEAFQVYDFSVFVHCHVSLFTFLFSVCSLCGPLISCSLFQINQSIINCQIYKK